ncbi:MAG TPA: acyl carrier protein [Candidatus Angelobacter sp.]|jgi:acyl carrier protein|nr:acyl carrier protein [Candidatus Angelobacter sp.]
MYDIESRVKDILAKKLGIDELTLESSLIKDLGIDSLDYIELIMAIEEEFHIKISDEYAESIFRIKDIVFYVNSLLKKDLKCPV